jgi:glycosyltransferase involved in cell wall biosynthesis
MRGSLRARTWITPHSDRDEERSPLLIYALYSGKLYGTERMALATLGALRGEYEALLFAPAGPIHDAAARNGVASRVVSGGPQLIGALLGHLTSGRRVVFFSTRVRDSIVFETLVGVLRTPHAHFHVVHGGSNERDSFGRKHRLLNRKLSFVAVSKFVREKLLRHGIPADRVQVVENFLPPSRLTATPKREGRIRSTVQRIAIVSRLDPIKRLDLLFDALAAHPDLREIRFRIFGTGSEAKRLAERAAAYPGVELRGFSSRVREELSWADAYLHLCPEEPFGLAVLEAIEAGLPVIVPDAGGSADIVRPGRDGLHFASDDEEALAATLRTLRASSPGTRQEWVSSASNRLENRYGPERGAREYRDLIERELR